MASDKDDRISELVPSDPPFYTCPHCDKSFSESEWDNAKQQSVLPKRRLWFSREVMGPWQFFCPGCETDIINHTPRLIIQRLMVQPIYCCNCEFNAKPRDGSDRLVCRCIVVDRDFVNDTVTLKYCEKINTRGQCKDYKAKEPVVEEVKE